MTSGVSEAALRDTLAQAETRTQDYLAERPPPFFVQRKLSLTGVQAEDRLPLLRKIFPTVADVFGLEMMAITDGAACTQRDDVACLNRYFYADLEPRLEASAGQVRFLLESARAAGFDRLVYEATELMAYLLVEKCHWQFITQPLPALRIDPALTAQAGSLLAAVLPEAKERRDWLLWHRIAANQARLGYLAGDPSPTLPRTFDSAMALGQLCLDHGFAVDRAFVSRRDELLHMAATVKFFQASPTYLNLSAHIKSPARIKPPPGEARLTIESGRLIGNLSLPLLVGLGETIGKSGEQAAFLDWLSTEDRVQLWMTHKGKARAQSLMYRDLHKLANLDLMFRPSLFEVTLEGSDKPMGEGAAPAASQGDKVAYIGPDFGRRTGLESDVIGGKKWKLRFPTLEVGLDESGARYRREFSPDMVGVPWETALGTLLQSLLPGPPDEPGHLVVSTDGPLSLLPFHLARMPDGRLLCERFHISYAPSVAYFSPAPALDPQQVPSVAVVLNSRNRLQGPLWELQRMKSRLGAAAVLELDGFDGDDQALQEALAARDVIHVATHGETFTDTPDSSGVELKRGRILTIRAIERFVLKPGCLVFLNACGSSRVTIRSRIQFSSIANAFLSAGASTVIATFWEADDVSAALLSDRFYRHLFEERRGRLESLNLAIQELKDIDLDDLPEQELGPLSIFLPATRKQPYRNASFWGQFALFGRW